MFEKQIQAGVTLLDAKMPGWESKIDLGILNMRSDTRCILGQLYGYFSNGRSQLGLQMPFPINSIRPDWSEIDNHGFHAESAEKSQILTDEWKKFISQRLTQKNLT